MANSKKKIVCFGLACGLLASASALADERFFTYIQDADVIPKGGWEFEQWVTFRKGYPGGDHDFDQYLWDFREEIEYGFTDKLSGALYLNFRQDQIVAQQPGLEGSSEFSFKGVSGELKYQLLNPNTKPVGIALYFEPTYNGNELELEYKLIASKNIGDKWVLAANAVFEQEWEKEEGETEKESVLEFNAGVAYRFTPNWSVGLEARYHSVYEGASLERAPWHVPGFSGRTFTTARPSGGRRLRCCRRSAAIPAMAASTPRSTRYSRRG